MKLRRRAVAPWSFWLGFALVLLGLLSSDALILSFGNPNGTNWKLNLGVVIAAVGAVVLLASFLAAKPIPEATAGGQTGVEGAPRTGPPGSRPGDRSPRAGGPPVS